MANLKPNLANILHKLADIAKYAKSTNYLASMPPIQVMEIHNVMCLNVGSFSQIRVAERVGVARLDTIFEMRRGDATIVGLLNILLLNVTDKEVELQSKRLREVRRSS